MRYTFSDCQLDTTSRDFLRNGDAIHLSPKAFELLRLLIEHRPRVMSKQELMEALWPGTFVVEANLPVLIGELRDALGEKTRGGAIKTHHGIGYSFAAAVEEQRSGTGRVSSGREWVYLNADGRRILLGPGPNQVGREPDCDVFLNHADVSRKHARIIVESGLVKVEDLESRNGTLVNGRRVTAPKRLESGDTITFGTVETMIEIFRSPPSTVTI